MMHHTITKKRSKDFSHFRIMDNKAFAGTRLIPTRKNGITECNKIPLIIPFETELILFTTFMSSCIFISFVKVEQQFISSSKKRARFGHSKCLTGRTERP